MGSSGEGATSSSLDTCCIVGRDSGSECMHLEATLAITITSLIICGSSGAASRGSIIFFIVMFLAAASAADDDNKVMTSFGCMPIITSSATTPKL